MMIRRKFLHLGMILSISLTSARIHDKSRTSSVTPRRLSSQPRELEKNSNVVSTSDCTNVRINPFAAKLELEYLYLVETILPLPNLKGVQNVNNRAILDALVTCDSNGVPEYALDLSIPHEQVDQGFCIPQDRLNICSIIRGRAYIYLDGGITEARDLAYSAVDKALSDPTFVVLFEPNIVYSRFVRSVQENILFVAADEPTNTAVAAANESRSMSVKIGIAVSSVVFIVLSIFALGVLRRQRKQSALREQAEARKELRKKSRLDRRRYFQSLEGDDSIVARPVAQLSTEHDGRSLIWSDITSDSGSATSMLSRTTIGRLQKIEEEPDHELNAEIENTWDVQAPLSSQHTAAFAAHASRLQELVRKACVGELEDDLADQNLRPYTLSPSTADTFGNSFDADDENFGSHEESQIPATPGSDMSANFSSITDFHTPLSGITNVAFHEDALISHEDYRLPSSFPSDQCIWEDAYNAPSPYADELCERDENASRIVLNRSADTTETDASLQRWLERLLLELHLSQQMKRIEQ